MISVETTNPVYSNLGGKTPEQKKDARGKAWEKTKTGYEKAKESGLLQGIENLVLKKGGSGTTDINANVTLPDPNATNEKKPMSKTLKIGLIVGGVAIVGFAVYWFAIRKSPSAK
jgi:hypothetical protein